MKMEGFSLCRLDRDSERTGKKLGGGLCLFVNDQWCHPGHVTVKETICDQNTELLAVICHPYYREFSHVIVQVVYIHPSGNGRLAMETILRVTYDMQ